MFNLFQPRLQYAGTSMDNFTTFLSSSTREETFQTHPTSLWVILLTEDIILSKLSNSSWRTKSDTLEKLLFSEETMNQDRSHLFMDSMMKSSENTETLILGSIALKCSTIQELPLQLKEKFFAFMEDFLLKSRQLIKSEQFRDARKFLMKDLSVISCGVILRTLRHGLCLPEEPVGFSDQK